MFTVAGPYLKNRSTKPKDMMHLPIDDDYAEEPHETITSVQKDQVNWYEQNKALIEQMLANNNDKNTNDIDNGDNH